MKKIKKRGNEPLKNFILLSLVRHKEQQGHKRNQSLTKHHHQHQHNSPSATIRLPRPSPTFSFSKKTEEPVDFSTEENAQITPTRSVDSWLTQLIFTPVLRYARAVDKVTDDSQVKIANISTSTPISSMATISMQPNKSVTGILKYCSLFARVIVVLLAKMFSLQLVYVLMTVMCINEPVNRSINQHFI